MLLRDSQWRSRHTDAQNVFAKSAYSAQVIQIWYTSGLHNWNTKYDKQVNNPVITKATSKDIVNMVQVTKQTIWNANEQLNGTSSIQSYAIQFNQPHARLALQW